MVVLSEALADILDDLGGDGGDGRGLDEFAQAEARTEQALADAEQVFAAVPTSGTMIRVPGGRERPPWAKEGARNCRGLVDPGQRHFLACITVNGSSVEGIVDTGACRTMMDVATARSLGLKTEERDPEDHPRKAPFGKFMGPNGELSPYEGRVVGVIIFAFSGRVALRLPEIRLVRTEDPLFLLGTDLLGPRRVGWKFMHVGYHPKDGRGVIAFSRDLGTDQEFVELAQAPGGCIRSGDELQGIGAPKEEWQCFGGYEPRARGGTWIREVPVSAEEQRQEVSRALRERGEAQEEEGQ